MSILLTAGKNAVKAKNKAKKHKKKRVPCGENVYEPPISTPRTVVWFWSLDAIPTTVMYTKETNEVWCNGKILNTQSRFPTEDGRAVVIEFAVGHNQHSAAIVKALLQGNVSCPVNHQLYVDNFMIHENMGQPPEESVTNISMDMGISVFSTQNVETQWAEPPSYESIVNMYDKKTQ